MDLRRSCVQSRSRVQSDRRLRVSGLLCCKESHPAHTAAPYTAYATWPHEPHRHTLHLAYRSHSLNVPFHSPYDSHAVSGQAGRSVYRGVVCWLAKGIGNGLPEVTGRVVRQDIPVCSWEIVDEIYVLRVASS